MEPTTDPLLSTRLLMIIATLIAAVITALIAIYVKHNFVPKMALAIESRRIPGKNIVVFKLILENVCAVYLPKEAIKFQVLEYEEPTGNALSEFVPLEERLIKPGEEPISWVEPVDIFKTTTGLQPGEIVTVERLYQFSENIDLLHVLLQYRTVVSPPVSWLIPKEFRPHEKWTTTIFVHKDEGTNS